MPGQRGHPLPDQFPAGSGNVVGPFFNAISMVSAFAVLFGLARH
jgi:hypothetical protein